jgi:beta-1,4-N-acetylglucosaminyltransferase
MRRRRAESQGRAAAPPDDGGSSSSSSAPPSPSSPYVFITVGTTSFDAFVSAACSAAFARAVHARGFSRVVLQVGRGTFSVPAWAEDHQGAGAGAGEGEWAFSVPVVPADDDAAPPPSSSKRSKGAARATTSPSPPSPSSSVEYRAFRFRPNIAEEVRGAGLVVSHAGSGSIFETLRAKRPLVVVVNTALADNHQVEIAEALGADGGNGSGSGSGSGYGPHLAWCEPAALVETVAALDVSKLRPLPPPDLSRFTAAVDSIMGKEAGAGEQPSESSAGSGKGRGRGRGRGRAATTEGR